MTSRQRLRLCSAFSALVLVLVLAIVWAFHSREPVYQGKPLSFWMLANARPIVKGQPDPAAALSAIGSNAVPFLLKWAEQKPFTWQKQLRPYRDKSAILRKIIPYWATGIDKQNRALAALEAIPSLGPAGRPAIPRLTILANNETDNSVGQLATTALAKLEAFPALITVATNQNAKARLNAIHYLGQLRDAAAVPALLQSLNGPDAEAAAGAARSLGLIHQASEVVVPALQAALRSELATQGSAQRDKRLSIASALAEFGTNADLAVPDLVRLLSTADQSDLRYCELVRALCRVSAQPQAVLPTLANCLQSTNLNLRMCIISYVAAMGPRGRFALPALTNALQFQETRDFAESAIYNITSQPR